MAGVTAHGATFSFAPIGGGVSYTAVVAGLSVETPSAELVDMTGAGASNGYVVLVPTGDFARGASGTVTVDYLSTGVNWQAVVGAVGTLSLSSPGHAVVRRVVLESASSEARAGDIVRGSLKFRMTDYTG